MPLNRGRFVVVHSCSTFSDYCQPSTSVNGEVQKMSNIGGFSPSEDDRVNRSRRLLARKRKLPVCYSTQNLAVIGKRGSVQEPLTCQKFAKTVVFGNRNPTQSIHSDEIPRVSVELGSALAHQI